MLTQSRKDREGMRSRAWRLGELCVRSLLWFQLFDSLAHQVSLLRVADPLIESERLLVVGSRRLEIAQPFVDRAAVGIAQRVGWRQANGCAVVLQCALLVVHCASVIATID